MYQREEAAVRGSLDGLWLVLVDGRAEEGRVPMMARAGDEQTYLLGFRNAHRARKFLETSPVPGAEPRMVVRSNKDELLRLAKASGAAGVLVDYDPQTRAYSVASAIS